MGTYLATGIVQNIIIGKNEIVKNQFTIKQVCEKLKEKINLSYFDFTEDAQRYYWKITPNVLEKNFHEFLNTQFKMYHSEIDSDMQGVLDKISKAKTGEQIIELAAAKEFSNFQLVDYLNDYIKLPRKEG